jgi:hypothetical protein
MRSIMGRTREQVPPAFVHDHFDGSAYCVECGGDCKLTGCELAFTSAVRFTLEAECYSEFIVFGMLESLFLKSLGKARLTSLRQRAAETHVPR